MKKLTFKKSDLKINYGLPNKLKIGAALIGLTFGAMTSCSVYDECPVADSGNHADSHDVTPSSDVDCTSGNL